MTCVKPPCGIGVLSGCNPTCECGPDLCNLPNPYVVDADTSEECHCSTIIQQLYVTGLSLKTSIVIPACNTTVTVAIAGIHSVIIGSYLWNPTYGHFKITGFDYATEQVTIENECQSTNAAVGTVIPTCTLFLAVDTPCCDDGVGGILYYPYLAVDFTAPAVGACLDITVTSVIGLSVGMKVQISTGVYLISSIVSPTIINVCNTLGAGITPGVAVEAQDALSLYITPILPVGVALCGGSTAGTGSLVVCDDGLPTVLYGDILGYVPAIVNIATHAVEFQDPAAVFPGLDPCSWDLSARVLNGIVNYYAYVAGGDIAVDGASEELDRMTTIPVLIENDTCVTGYVMLSFSGYCTSLVDADDGDYANIEIALSVGSNIALIGTSAVVAGPVVATVPKEIAFNRTAANIEHSSRVEWFMSYIIPAGDELQIGFQVEVTDNASNVNIYDTQEIYGEVKGYFLSI